MTRKNVHVGIIGAGIGGLAAGIAIARGGATVTILEATMELGEIGAGIQMLPNVSRFLIRWGVDKIIGDNLLAHPECRTYWGEDARLIALTNTKSLATATGFPWWVVRRDHLHAGLASAAKKHGVNIILGARVKHIDDSTSNGVNVWTTDDKVYHFDLAVGADGVKSVVRNQFFPSIVPKAPSKVAAYRGVLTYEKIYREIPEAAQFFGNSMDVWMGKNGYILTYPISGGKECNIVTAFCKDDFVTQMEEVDINEFRAYYKDYHPVIQKVLQLVGYTQRWPLLQMPKMERWTNEKRSVVLMGDAAHCMQNHMAQGAATAVEDGAFLGRIISEVIRGTINIAEATELYENSRIPKAWIKQQISFVSGIVNMMNTEEEYAVRNSASKPEIEALRSNPVLAKELSYTYRSWQYYCFFNSVPAIFTYDAEGDADNALCEYLQKRGVINESEMLSANLKNLWSDYVTTPDIRTQGSGALAV